MVARHRRDGRFLWTASCIAVSDRYSVETVQEFAFPLPETAVRTSMEARTPVPRQVIVAGSHAPRRLSARRVARRRCASVAGWTPHSENERSRGSWRFMAESITPRSRRLPDQVRHGGTGAPNDTAITCSVCPTTLSNQAGDGFEPDQVRVCEARWDQMTCANGGSAPRGRRCGWARRLPCTTMPSGRTSSRAVFPCPPRGMLRPPPSALLSPFGYCRISSTCRPQPQRHPIGRAGMLRLGQEPRR